MTFMFAVFKSLSWKCLGRGNDNHEYSSSKLSLFEPIARSFLDVVGKELTFYFQSKGTVWRSSILRKLFVLVHTVTNLVPNKW